MKSFEDFVNESTFVSDVLNNPGKHNDDDIKRADEFLRKAFDVASLDFAQFINLIRTEAIPIEFKQSMIDFSMAKKQNQIMDEQKLIALTIRRATIVIAVAAVVQALATIAPFVINYMQ